MWSTVLFIIASISNSITIVKITGWPLGKTAYSCVLAVFLGHLSNNGNDLLFHMTQPTSKSTIKAIACSKPTISEHRSKWKLNGTIADQCKQRGALCHIGLAKDRGGHLVNQPRYITFWQVLRSNSWRSNKHNEKKNKKRMNAEHGEEMNSWKRMPMYMDEWIEFKRRNLVWLEYF